MSPGAAWRYVEGRTEAVPITEAQAKRAKYKWLLAWIAGRTVVLFDLEGEEYAQPTEAISTRKGALKHARRNSQAPIKPQPESAGAPRTQRKGRKPLALWRPA